MAAAEQELTVARQEILTAQIDEEAVAKTVQCYLILYVKSMKEFKEERSNIIAIAISSSIFHLAKSHVNVHITDIRQLCCYVVVS